MRLSKAAQTMPTVDYGKECGVSESPYIGKCVQNEAIRAMVDKIASVRRYFAGKSALCPDGLSY